MFFSQNIPHAFAPLASLLVSAGAGTDSVNIDFSGGASPVPAVGLTVDGSTGMDTLTLTGTTGNDIATVNATTVAVNNGSPLSYTNVESIVFNGNGGTDSLTQSAQPGNSVTLAFNGTTSGGPSTTDTLNVNTGTFTFAAPTAGSGIRPLSLAALSIGAGVLLKYTYLGDANLDGRVDGSDYTRIDNGFHNHLTGWGNGDFNFNRVIDGSDYTLIDNALNTQAGSLSLIAPSAMVLSHSTSKAGAAEAVAAAKLARPAAIAQSVVFNSGSPIVLANPAPSLDDLLLDQIKHGTEGLFVGR